MNTSANHMKFGGAPGDIPSLKPAAASRIRRFVQAVLSRWKAARTRNASRDLDRLEDWMLKDVGLFREHLPDGTTRIRRR